MSTASSNSAVAAVTMGRTGCGQQGKAATPLCRPDYLMKRAQGQLRGAPRTLFDLPVPRRQPRVVAQFRAAELSPAVQRTKSETAAITRLTAVLSMAG